jgi:hypothetical protein
MASPLDSFVSKVGAGQIKLPELPNLGEMITASDFKSGMAAYHSRMSEVWRELEKILNERFASKDPVPPGTLQ